MKNEEAKLATESTEKQTALLKTYADTSDSALLNLNKIKTEDRKPLVRIVFTYLMTASGFSFFGLR